MQAHVIKRPIITEKTLFLASTANAYTFEVQPSATKTQVVKAIEELFGVKVTGVNTVMRSRSMRRTGKRRTTIIVPRKKKAIVTLVKGQTIALFDVTAGEAA